ncbi:Putative uncharacterized protein [Taphrina deformans PYCC 5710]|uniref:Cap binding protein n=1 Tax=Taphrina deformans (strain PYCC 5710 / ATCC 11124 / CBS 356.35 / IMI 108563 / JCM 9778 / NBRC 8474) TaxID=1097556 RepID=R4X9M8_TAPDE|nr:Putative uncharacterized protein [Taphrina deformans PYCC 5710]|eukprot:CCG82130.1 Putative uncharacterized protein [Taphrina deformans PYCC 5710]
MSNGGHYGHNGGRQQRKRPRDYDDDQYRRPRTVDVLEKLKRDLINLADPGNVGPLEDIKYVAKKIAIDFATTENQDRILELLLECLLQLTVKTSQYGAIISLASAQNKEFGTRFLTTWSDSLTQSLKQHSWRDVKLFLRVAATLSYCVSKTSEPLLDLLNEMLATNRIGQQSSRNEVADCVCETILITLPYLINGLREVTSGTRDQITNLLGQIGTYVSLNDLSEETDPLSLLYNQCKSASQAGWKIQYLPHFAATLPSDLTASDLELPSISVPDMTSVEVHRPSRQYLHIFTNQIAQSVPTDQDLAASVFRDLVTDTLDLLVTNRKDAARFLIDLESYLPPNLFVLRGTPLDKIPEGGPTWKAEDIVVEAIFSELFALALPTHKPVYYHSVLTELCKLVPQAIAPTFGRAIRAIYNNMENMESELVYRFWDWFSHHLSNFGFNWKWQEWIPDLDQVPTHPKSVFIRETIEKEAELSYNQRIKTTLPSDYHKILPDEAPGPDFPCNTTGHPYYEETSTLLTELTATAALERVNEQLSAIRRKAIDEGSDPEEQELHILVSCILQLGHQSFSHALNTIERNLQLLQTKCDSSPTSRRTTVATVMAFWSGRPFIASTLLQKLLNYRLISPMSILQNLLLDSPSAVFTRSTTWELVRTTIEKVNARVTQVRARLDKLTNESNDNESTENAMDTAETTTTEPETVSELDKLRKTWVDVQEEQRDVFTFTISQLSTRVADLKRDAGDDPWALYWIRGLYRSILRRNKAQIVALRDELPSDDAELTELLSS